jgi:two-component system cell cycle sensor histidine kinase/response regulator CckA
MGGLPGSTSTARRPLNVLLLEDQETDAELILVELRRAGYQATWRRIDNETDFLKALDTPPEVILADFNLKGFDAIRALELVVASGLDVPLIVVSGSIGEETAIALLKHGAADYLLKDRLARLGPSIQRALADRALRAEKAQGERERVVLEEQYRQAQKMEAVGQLAGGIAHDFNNVLTAIQGYGELLAEQVGGNDQALSDIHEVLRAVERATTLTRQLLMFSRRQALETKVLDLRETLAGIEPMLRRLIREDVDIAVHKTDDVATINADQGQIEQVILNLVVNARDAMPDGGKLLIETAVVTLDQTHVSRHAGTEPGRYVMLAVTDTGSGMDVATRQRIFEPFFTTKQKGTGLGLATVYGIVKQCGGDIFVYSEPAHGTTFKVFLPFVDIVPEAAPLRAAAEPLEGSGTVLVVEDEDGVRHLVQRVLERFGYRVLVAASPHEALRIARGERLINLLMSDVVLPGLSGPDLAEQIVAIQPGIRVLYMSGYTDEAIVHRGLLNAGTPFLEKPFTPETLAKKVRQVLK